MKIHRFPIGMQFVTAGKHPRLCTVVDQLTTVNSAGYVVKIEYISTHEFAGQVIKSTDCETTVARGACNLQKVARVSDLIIPE